MCDETGGVWTRPGTERGAELLTLLLAESELKKQQSSNSRRSTDINTETLMSSDFICQKVLSTAAHTHPGISSRVITAALQLYFTL